LLKEHRTEIPNGELPSDLIGYLHGPLPTPTLTHENGSSEECPPTPSLILSDEILYGGPVASLLPFETQSNMNLPAVELIEDSEPTIIEDEKKSEEENLAREEEKENAIVAIVFWDLETSGKTSGSNVEYIIEIGCLGWKCNSPTATETFSSLVKPSQYTGECTITTYASRTSGLYSRDVVQAKQWNDVYLLWIQYLSNIQGNRGKILMLAHNSQSADENCLKCDCERYQLLLPSYLIFGDTYLLYKKLHETTSKWSVDYLCEKFNVIREGPSRSTTSSRGQYHGALEDAKTLYKLSLKMVEKSLLYSSTVPAFDQIVKNFT